MNISTWNNKMCKLYLNVTSYLYQLTSIASILWQLKEVPEVGLACLVFFIHTEMDAIFPPIKKSDTYQIKLLLLIDFEKAFDFISWKFIDDVLEFFNFGDNFIVKTH